MSDVQNPEKPETFATTFSHYPRYRSLVYSSALIHPYQKRNFAYHCFTENTLFYIAIRSNEKIRPIWFQKYIIWDTPLFPLCFTEDIEYWTFKIAPNALNYKNLIFLLSMFEKIDIIVSYGFYQNR